MLRVTNRSFGSVAQHSRMPTQKCYYTILGIDSDATPEQIKDAYREQAKKFHPDVVGGATPSAEQFRDVQEAYAVLSVMQSRANYDLLRKKDPDSFREMTEREFNKNYNVSARDASGNVPAAAPAEGSYAEQRLAELKAQRAQYNVNDIGFYRGGVPQKGRGALRGPSMGVPGEFHQPNFHNYLNFYHPDSKIINSEDAMKFKAFMVSDKSDFTMSRPSQAGHIDRNMDFMKDRSFWLALIFGMFAFMYAKKRYYVETMRMQRWERMENLENAPAHHYNNRGGVLVRKQFAGFEKYHKNIDEMMAWYAKSYPAKQE